MSDFLFQIKSADDVLRLVEDMGFLPFFENHIPGFSVEECCPRELWFAEGVDGPWEWKQGLRYGHYPAANADLYLHR